jgi:hypothetical protein
VQGKLVEASLYRSKAYNRDLVIRAKRVVSLSSGADLEIRSKGKGSSYLIR